MYSEHFGYLIDINDVDDAVPVHVYEKRGNKAIAAFKSHVPEQYRDRTKNAMRSMVNTYLSLVPNLLKINPDKQQRIAVVFMQILNERKK